MQRICLVSLVGLPAVGKSTLCEHLMLKESMPFNILHLCYDNYVKYNAANPKHYREQRENLLQTLRKIIENFKNFKTLKFELNFLNDYYKDNRKEDLIILCDDNHYYVSMRYKLYQLAREYSLGYCQLYFETQLDVALQLNRLRCKTKQVPAEVIFEMSKRFETPNKLANKWEENTFNIKTLDLIKDQEQDIIDFIKQFLDKPLEPLPVIVNKITTPQTLVHNLDLLLRKRINTLMVSSVLTNKKSLAKNLNDKRKEILKVFQLQDISNDLESDLDLNKYVEMLNDDYSE